MSLMHKISQVNVIQLQQYACMSHLPAFVDISVILEKYMTEFLTRDMTTSRNIAQVHFAHRVLNIDHLNSTLRKGSSDAHHMAVRTYQLRLSKSSGTVLCVHSCVKIVLNHLGWYTVFFSGCNKQPHHHEMCIEFQGTVWYSFVSNIEYSLGKDIKQHLPACFHALQFLVSLHTSQTSACKCMHMHAHSVVFTYEYVDV